jgi:hypothetical protein
VAHGESGQKSVVSETVKSLNAEQQHNKAQVKIVETLKSTKKFPTKPPKLPHLPQL